MRMPGLAACLCLSLLAAAAGPGAARDLDRDLPGARDLPGVPRYPGSVIIGLRASDNEETLIPAGPWDQEAAGGGAWTRSREVEGRRTRILYLAPRDAASEAVVRHYQQSLEGGGYRALYQCSGRSQCGEGVEKLYNDPAQDKQLRDSFLLQSAFSEGTLREPQLYTARRETSEGEVFVLVLAAYQDNFADSEAGERVAVFLEQVRAAQAQRDELPAGSSEPQDAAGLARALEQSGRAALRGILFADGTAEIRPESRPQLEALAQMLSERPELEVYVVGHTDSSGTLEANMALSQRRAEAVVESLIRRYGVVGARLTPKGIASLAPLASNATDQGRAMNRRIELVVR